MPRWVQYFLKLIFIKFGYIIYKGKNLKYIIPNLLNLFTILKYFA